MKTSNNNFVSTYKSDVEDFIWEIEMLVYPPQYVHPEQPIMVHLKKHLRQYFKKAFRDIFPARQVITIDRDFIVSENYLNHHLSSQFDNIGLVSVSPPWLYSDKTGRSTITKQYRYLSAAVTKGIQFLNDEEFVRVYASYKEELEKFFSASNIKGIVLTNDLTFTNKIVLKIFKKLNKPSIIYLHGGMPHNYSKHRFTSSDYLAVWGKEHKANYINNGFDATKVKVVGHPVYSSMSYPDNLRHDLSNILVLSRAPYGGQKLDKIILRDPSGYIVYLNLIEHELKKYGVQSVRLRLHPGEPTTAYERNINMEFYKLDCGPLTPSLNQSSLVIGPPSTVFLDSLCHGVNYIIFEPLNKLGKALDNMVPHRPADNSDPDIPVAQNSQDLGQLITAGSNIDHAKVINKYIKRPFDISFIADIV
jgi:hypothetical protein